MSYVVWELGYWRGALFELMMIRVDIGRDWLLKSPYEASYRTLL
jgi:hypothetical protein